MSSKFSLGFPQKTHASALYIVERLAGDNRRPWCNVFTQDDIRPEAEPRLEARQPEGAPQRQRPTPCRRF